MIYPHKYHLPIALDKDVKSVSTRIPVGLLKLTVVSANGLKSSAPLDFMSCDPFVVLSVSGHGGGTPTEQQQEKQQQEQHKTPVIKNSHSPVWNETFHLMIFDKETDVVELSVCDDDMTRRGSGRGGFSSFGYGSLSLHSLPPFDIVTRELVLESEDDRELRLKREAEEEKRKKKIADAASGSSSSPSLLQKLADTAVSHSPIRFSSSSVSVSEAGAAAGGTPADLKRSKSKNIAKLQLLCEYLPLRLSSSASSVVSGTNSSSNGPPPTDILFDLSPKGLTDELLTGHVPLLSLQQPIPDMATAALQALASEAHTKRLQNSHSLSQQAAAVGVLTVSGLHGKNFKMDHSSSSVLSSAFSSSTLRPYLLLSVGTVKHRTAVQKDLSNPFYSESFNFVVLDPTATVLLVKVPSLSFPCPSTPLPLSSLNSRTLLPWLPSSLSLLPSVSSGDA
jgi:hypothetical protein